MKGWFDAFRNDGGPTLYSYSNRTPVTGDVHLITIFIIFCTIFAAFLIIFPGIRKERVTTFFTVTLSLFVGASIQVAQYGSTWHTTSSQIVSTYSVFSRHRTHAEIGGYIGLMHINITYKLVGNREESQDGGDIEFNERFWWRSPTEMSDAFKSSLQRGTPFPIISLAEYFSLHQEGFSWGTRYREAGHWASIILWTSFAAWMITNLLLVVVPRYGAYGMIFTGTLMLLTNLTYWSLLPSEPLVAHIDGSILIFNFGWNYWLLLAAGVVCVLGGTVIAVIDLIFPHQFSTILEVDYDTPYDRHVIIEESFDTRNVGNKLPKIVDDDLEGRIIMSKLSKMGSDQSSSRGIVNQGYDPPDYNRNESDTAAGKNWAYPFPPVSRRIND
ncbi:dual oxidase maturation factor 1 [Diachasmimorpha longicaudata]|uniref:dual oxidase maturation factor 1 n=1 Tax=Diachasmimorpha longicaudata TaxID=58733 RepID=UPI0030B8A6CC